MVTVLYKDNKWFLMGYSLTLPLSTLVISALRNYSLTRTVSCSSFSNGKVFLMHLKEFMFYNFLPSEEVNVPFVTTCFQHSGDERGKTRFSQSTNGETWCMLKLSGLTVIARGCRSDSLTCISFLLTQTMFFTHDRSTAISCFYPHQIHLLQP